MQALQWFQSALSRALRMPLTSSSNTHATCNHCLLRVDPHKFFFVGSRRSSYWKIIQAQLFVVYIIMPNRGRPTTRKSARTRQGPAAAAQTPEQTNFRSMATEPLRLLLAQHNLTQTGTRQQLIVRLEANQEVPNPQSGSDVSLNRTVQDSNLAPQAELAQLIASIIDEKLASRQDGGHPQTPRATPREGHAVEPSPTPLQDGRQQLQRWPSTTTKPPHASIGLPCSLTTWRIIQLIRSSHRRCPPSGFPSTVHCKPPDEDHDDSHHER